MDAIKTISLTKKYKDVTAVDRLNLSVAQGECFALLGVNGAGKTTTVKMLSCLTSPSDGDAEIFGHSIVTEGRAVKRLIALSPQETAIAPTLSVKENLQLICGIYGISGDKMREKIRSISSDLGLDTVMGRPAGRLSGGWQRRLSIAMALISEPSLLFLDEPTLGLDVLARHELWDIIKGLKGRVTVILTTHYMEEAEALADRIGIMKTGRLLEVGTAEEIKAKAGCDRFEEAFVKIVKEAEL